MVIHFYRTDYLSAVRFSCDCRFLTPNEFSFSSFTDICYKVKTVFKKDVVFLTIQPKPVALFVGRGVYNPNRLALRFTYWLQPAVWIVVILTATRFRFASKSEHLIILLFLGTHESMIAMLWCSPPAPIIAIVCFYYMGADLPLDALPLQAHQHHHHHSVNIHTQQTYIELIIITD